MKFISKTVFSSLLCIFFSQIGFSQELQATAVQDDCIEGERIVRFRVQDRGMAPSRNWKVVVGRTINYRANPNSPGMWNWSLGSGDCTAGNPFVSFWNLTILMVVKVKRGKL